MTSTALDDRVPSRPDLLDRLPLPFEIAFAALRLAIGVGGVLLIVLLAQVFYWAVARLLPIVAPL